MAGILKPQSGRVSVSGAELVPMTEAAARDFRANHIGFIFQDFALLDYLNVEDNILLPYRINPSLTLNADVRARMTRLLGDLGIAHKAAAFPAKLSFGERQRAAIARAMITSPKTILADEPTANLDRANALKTIELIIASAARDNAGLVVVSHDESLDSYFDRVVDMAQFKRV
jgi:putative ABC transport system ATP-binding protein